MSSAFSQAVLEMALDSVLNYPGSLLVFSKREFLLSQIYSESYREESLHAFKIGS